MNAIPPALDSSEDMIDLYLDDMRPAPDGWLRGRDGGELLRPRLATGAHRFTRWARAVHRGENVNFFERVLQRHRRRRMLYWERRYVEAVGRVDDIESGQNGITWKMAMADLTEAENNLAYYRTKVQGDDHHEVKRLQCDLKRAMENHIADLNGADMKAGVSNDFRRGFYSSVANQEVTDAADAARYRWLRDTKPWPPGFLERLNLGGARYWNKAIDTYISDAATQQDGMTPADDRRFNDQWGPNGD